MILTRRRALLGLLAAPVIIRTPGLLMPVRPVPARVYGWNVGEWFTVRIGTENRDYQIIAAARGDGFVAYGTPEYIRRQITQHFTFGAEVETMSREEIRRALRGARIVKPP